MLPRKWSNMERQRPRLRLTKWGFGIGALITVGSIVGIGSWPLGVVLMAGSAIWAFMILNK